MGTINRKMKRAEGGTAMDEQAENKRRMINIAQLCVCQYQCDGDEDYIRQAIAYLTVALKIVPPKE